MGDCRWRQPVHQAADRPGHADAPPVGTDHRATGYDRPSTAVSMKAPSRASQRIGPVGECSWWGWGEETAAVGGAEREALARLVQARLGVQLPDPLTPPPISTVQLREPALAAPASVASLFTHSPRERLRHSRGRSFRDVVRNLRGDFEHVTDLVAAPLGEDDVVRILDWASTERAAVIPFGGGSSVVGGVEPDVGDGYAGTVSLDLRHLDRVLEVDSTS